MIIYIRKQVGFLDDGHRQRDRDARGASEIRFVGFIDVDCRRALLEGIVSGLPRGAITPVNVDTERFPGSSW
jgi:hypothetical protein